MHQTYTEHPCRSAILIKLQSNPCMKILQMWSFFWSIFSCIRTEYGDILRKSVQIEENTD